MILTSDILKAALESLPLPAGVFVPGGKFWLTLYIFGSAESYAKARVDLDAQGWLNLDDSIDYAGFAYPKKQVINDLSEVRDVLNSALAICDKTAMGISLIDADTAFDPGHSSFHTLFRES